MLRRRLALPLALVLLAGAALAGTQPGSEPIDRLIERSGLAAQLSHFEASMQSGITAAHAAQRKLSPEEIGRLRQAVSRAYAASSLRPVLRSELAKRLSSREITAALAWLDSPTGRKLIAMEEAAAAPEVQRRIESAARGAAPALAPARAKTLHALIRATHADEVGAAILIETAAGVTEGGNYATPETIASARRELEARRKELVAALHERSFVAFAVVYAQASDADLAALLAFAQSPAGVKYHSASAQAFESALAKAARTLGGELAVPAAPAGI